MDVGDGIDQDRDTGGPGRGRWRVPRRGGVSALVIACLGLGAGVLAIVLLHTDDRGPQLMSAQQLPQLELSGTWRDKSGAEIVFRDTESGHGSFDGLRQPGGSVWVRLLVESDGSAAPVLTCKYPDNDDECTFRKR